MGARGPKQIDRTGMRVGKLLVIRQVASKAEGKAIRSRWLCQCDCGNTCIVVWHSMGQALRNKGGTKSCGCLTKIKPIKHGKSGARIYFIWNTMLQRCTNPKNPAYRSYGARGITVSEDWHDFQKFYADMGDRPQGMTLERIDNSHGYSKENCRWATRKEQGNNRRSNTFLTYCGKRQTLAQWADETGLEPMCIMSRIRSGWSVEAALSTHKHARTAIKSRRFS